MTGMKEQRRSQRYRHELIVEMHDKRGLRRLHAVDVARHGVFLVTDEPPRERHLVQLTLHLPGGAIRAAASVTRTIAHARDDQPAGAGLQFFALSDDDKQRWDDFIFFLQRTTPPQGIKRPDFSTGPGSTATTEKPKQLAAGGGATFLVKLKSVERLQDFQSTHLAAGGTVLFTPVLRAPGEQVTLIVVHPKSDEEFKLPGVIARAHADRPKRLEIHFVGVTPSVMNAFRAFVESGRPPSIEPVRPELPASSVPLAIGEKKDFDLDVDVFDEDTLDTDERIAAPESVAGAPAMAPAGGSDRRASADPGLKPTTYLVRCGTCSTEAYAIDLGPCRGVLGLIANHMPFIAAESGRIITAPRLVVAEERAARVQEFLQRGGVLNASVDLMTLLGAVALTEPPMDPESGKTMRSSRALERLEASAEKLTDGAEPAKTKVKCHACKDGTVTVERVQI
jgi:hypothetical protein